MGVKRKAGCEGMETLGTTDANAVVDRVRERFSETVEAVRHFRGEWTIEVDCQGIAELLRFLRDDPGLQFDFLADLTAVDYLQMARGVRFAVVYHLYSHPFNQRLRVQAGLADSARRIPTAVGVWPGANWLEREVYDMFGIEFVGHPDLRRILLPINFEFHPLCKDYPLKGRGERDHLAPEDPGFDDLDCWLQQGEREADPERLPVETMLLNLGPQHPAVPGSLRLALELEGEDVIRARLDPGYLHTGFEKLGEHRTYNQYVIATDRLNHHAPFANNLALALAVERLLGLEVPWRGQYIRVILNELARINDHLAWLGVQARDAGAIAVAAVIAEQREALSRICEATTGARTMTSFTRIGGVPEDLPLDFAEMVRMFFARLRRTADQVHRQLGRNRLWIDRARGVGAISAEEAIAWGLSGPVLRAAGVGRDVRQDEPYCSYGEFDFTVPVGVAGDVYDRYLVRLEEVEQSCRIVEQAVEHLPDGPHQVEDAKISLPAKDEVGARAESLIHHFKLWMDGHGLQPPAGEQVYFPTESPKGELGFYLVSDGTDRAYRMRVRAPSFMHYQIFEKLAAGLSLADVGTVLGSMNIAVGELDR